jgi:cathepsin B
VKECHPESGRTYSQDKIHGVDAYGVPHSEDAIKNEIFKYGPVEVGQFFAILIQAAFTVYEDFLNYKKGVYQHVSGS